jgi:hypothetical protein
MTVILALERPRPLLTGGGGTVIEALLGLAAGVTATLAALAWRRPSGSDANHEERAVDGERAEPTRPMDTTESDEGPP